MTNQTDRMLEAREVLQKHWGYEDFREAQKEILPEILEGEDVLCILPTGGGKSVLFQVPALLGRGSTLVISPLIALMKDQVDDCIRRGISASFVNSHVDPEEAERRFGEWVDGAYQLLYIAPERISVKSFQRALQKANVERIAVDEAHCAAQWGHDFRPAYGRIHEIVEAVERYTDRRPSILACTATATWEIEGQIAQAIGLRDGYTRYVADPLRPNLKYEVVSRGSSWTAFKQTLAEIRGDAGRIVVYSTTRNGARELADIAEETLGVDVGVYHAGVEQGPRGEIQDAFKEDRLQCVVATSAFGMGIDVPDIRAVIHFGIPDSLESYMQQAGRAGRDGKASRCILIADDKAIDLQQFFLDGLNPPYATFGLLWQWLHTQLGDDVEIMRLSAKRIAEELQRTTGRREFSDNQITTVLNTLEAHGMVERMYEAEATPIDLIVSPLREKLKAATKDSMRSVIEALARSLGLTPNEKRVTVSGFIDKKAIGAQAKVSVTVVNTVLKQLDAAKAIVLGETYVGKTTRIKKYGIALASVLPKEGIEHKRARAMARLAQIRAYACTKTEAQRHALVRHYFLGDET